MFGNDTSSQRVQFGIVGETRDTIGGYHGRFPLVRRRRFRMAFDVGDHTIHTLGLWVRTTRPK